MIEVPDVIREPLKARALAWFNEQRERMRLEPLEALPAAEPQAPYNCLICRSLGGGDFNQRIEVGGQYGGNRMAVDLQRNDCYGIPDEVFALACAFDEGAFPELIDVEYPLSADEWKPETQAEAQAIIDRLAAEAAAERGADLVSA